MPFLTSSVAAKRAVICARPRQARHIACHFKPSPTKTELIDGLKRHHMDYLRLPEDEMRRFNDLIGKLEAENPTEAPENCQDKLAGTWLQLYDGRHARTEWNGLHVHDIYFNVDIMDGTITQQIQFSEDGTHALPGHFELTAKFVWEDPCTLGFGMQCMRFTSQVLKDRLEDLQEDMMNELSFRGDMKVTYEDDGLLIGHGVDDGVKAVFQHRITRVHA